MEKIKTGVLIVCHGSIAKSMVSALEIITGKIDGIVNIGFFRQNTQKSLGRRIKKALSSLLKQFLQVIILTDLPNGICSNTVQNILYSFFQRELHDLKIGVICGVNLPMLMNIISHRHCPLTEIISSAITSATKNIRQL